MKGGLRLLLLGALACSHRTAPPAPAIEPPLRWMADLHVHLTMDEAAKPVFEGEPGQGPLASTPSTLLTNQVEADGLEQAGIRVMLGAVWPPFRIRPGRTARDEALNQLEQLKRFSRRQPFFALTLTARQARRALEQGRVAVFPAVEGGEGVGSPEDLDAYYALGMRSLTVVHFLDNDLAGAAAGQLGRVFGSKPTDAADRGLSPLGRQVVERAFDLGILLDLAHSSDQTARAVLDLAEARGAPVIYSHGGSRRISGLERNLSDELAVRIAATGGQIGVTLYRAFVGEVGEGERFKGFVPDSCDEVIAHWLYFARLVGPAAVTLGSDFNGMVVRPQPGGSCPNGIRNTSDMAGLMGALERRGVPRVALDGAGERLLRAFEKAEGLANPAVQRAALGRVPQPATLFPWEG